MNKQDAIERIKKISEYPATYPCAIVRTPNAIEVIKSIHEPKITDQQAWNKIAEYYPETVQSLRITLDHAVYGQEAESQKVKVPAYVAEWIERNKSGDVQLIIILKYFGQWYEMNENENLNDEICKWVIENSETFMRAWLDGYEIEEEPKWKIINDQKYCLTSIEAGYGNSLHWAFDSTKKKPILFDNEETALYTAYITGGTVEKV